MAKDHHHPNHQHNANVYAEPRRDSKLIRILHSLVLFTFSVIAVVSAIISYLKIGSSSASAVDVVNNWKTKAIMDISIQTNCTDGYEEAFNYTWPGNKPGCFCGDADYKQKSKYRISFDENDGLCTANQTNAGCVNIHANPPSEVDSWSRIDGDAVKMCVKRSDETWAQVAQTSGAVCPPNTIQCGQSPNSIFCSNGTRCPINDLQIVTLNASLNAANIAKCVYEAGCMTLARDSTTIKVLQFKRGDTNDGLPLAQIRLNEYSMCNITGKDNISPGREDFYLLRERRETCGNEGADLWRLTDTMTEDKLFDINELTPTIDYLTDFGYYNDSESGRDYQWHLFSRGYLPWNLTCRDDMDELADSTHGIKSLQVTHLLQLIVTSVIAFLLGIVTPIFILRDSHHGFTKVFNILGKVIQAPFQLGATILAYLIGQFFAKFVTNQCSSPNVLSRLATAGADAQNAYKDDLRGLIALLLAALFDLGLWLYKRYGRSREEEYYPQVNIEQTLQNRNDRELEPYPQQTYPQQTYPQQTYPYAPQGNQYQGNQYPQAGVDANVNVRVGV